MNGCNSTKPVGLPRVYRQLDSPRKGAWPPTRIIHLRATYLLYIAKSNAYNNVSDCERLLGEWMFVNDNSGDCGRGPIQDP